MAFKYLAGSLMNLVARGTPYGATPTTTPEIPGVSADASYPLANAYNGVCALPFRLSAATTGFYVRWANNLVLDGDMEQTGTSEWTASNATPSKSGSSSYKGSSNLRITTSATGGGVYQDVTAQAGEYLQLRAAAFAASGTARVEVRCLDTMKSLNSSGAWTTVGTFAYTTTSGSYAAMTPLAFQVPTFSEVGRETVTLRILLTGSNNGVQYGFDEVLLIPGLDFVGVFGHGFDPSTGVALATFGADYWHIPSGAISFGSETNAACARQVAILTNPSRVYDPFPAVFFYPGGAWATYTSLRAPWIGELVVGQTRTFPRDPSSFNVASGFTGQMRSKTRGGTASVFNANAWRRRDVKMSVMHTSHADSLATEAEFLLMGEGGRYPVILLPESLDADDALYGRVTDSMTFDYETPRGRFSTTEIAVEEEALPRLT